jgi:hypothetical protein
MTQKLNRVFLLGSGFSSSMGLPTLAGLFKALMEFPERPGESYETERAALDACVVDVAEQIMGFHNFSGDHWDGLGLKQKLVLVREAFDNPEIK